MGRKCSVPHCYTGYRNCTEKASLYRVPDDEYFLSKWQEAIAREDRLITPKDYVCEKHFKEDDILRKRIIKDVVEQYQRPRLKPDAIPSIFPDLPEFILKMVKKRRKMFEVCNVLKSEDKNVTEQNFIEKEVKTEPLEANDAENFTGTVCESILNNELDIKNEPDEITEYKTEKCEESNENDKLCKMYQCEQCEYKTKYVHNLKTHKIKHLTGDNVYIHCEHCANFKTKWNLSYRNHLKNKHGIGKRETFKCTTCPFETKLKSSLKRHCKRHQNQLEDSKTKTKVKNSYKCVKCPYTTEWKNNLSKHITEHDEMYIAVFKCLRCTFVTFLHGEKIQCGNEFVCEICGFRWSEMKASFIPQSKIQSLNRYNDVVRAFFHGNSSRESEEKCEKEAIESLEFVTVKNEVSYTECD